MFFPVPTALGGTADVDSVQAILHEEEAKEKTFLEQLAQKLKDGKVRIQWNSVETGYLGLNKVNKGVFTVVAVVVVVVVVVVTDDCDVGADINTGY